MLANGTNLGTLDDRSLFTNPGDEDELGTSTHDSRLVFETDNFNQSELALYMKNLNGRINKIVPS